MKQTQLPFSYLRKLDKHDIPVILWNLFPVAGVLFAGWKPESVFTCYALETIVVGVFNVFKMIAVYHSRVVPKEGEKPTGWTWILIPFFMVHYFVFADIQLSIFFSINTNQDQDLFQTITALLHERSYNIALGAFVLNNAYSFINDFILTGKYAQQTMNEQMVEPYPRIIVQVVVVMFGGFILSLTGNPYPVLFIFVGFKMYLDLLLRYYPLSVIMAKSREMPYQ